MSRLTYALLWLSSKRTFRRYLFFSNFLSKGACFRMSQSELVPCIFPLGGSNDHSPAQPHIMLVLGVSVSPAVLVPSPCELCVAGRGDLQTPQCGPCAGPICSTSQPLLCCGFKYLLELLCKWHDSSNSENQGFTLCQFLSSIFLFFKKTKPKPYTQ